MSSLAKNGEGFLVQIMYALQYVFARKMGTNLPIYELSIGDKFDDYVTTKKD